MAILYEKRASEVKERNKDLLSKIVILIQMGTEATEWWQHHLHSKIVILIRSFNGLDSGEIKVFTF